MSSAATAAGDGDLLADTLGMFQHNHLASALSCLNRAEHTGSSSADYYNVFLDHEESVSLGNGEQKAENPNVRED